MKRYTFIAVVALIAAAIGVGTATDVYAKKSRKSKPRTTATTKPRKTTRSASDIRRERTNMTQEISATRRKISDNERATRNQVNKLNDINSQIYKQNRHITTLQNGVDSLDASIAETQTSIQQIQTKIDTLRQGVARALRQQRARRRQVNNLAFIFSSDNFNMAVRRIAYLRQLNRTRLAKVSQLREYIDELNNKQDQLNVMRAGKVDALNQLSVARSVLVTQQNQSQKIVNDLRRQGASLQSVLADRRRRLQQLDRELDRIIAEEQRRIAEEQERARRREQEQRRRQQDSNRGGKPSKRNEGESASRPAESKVDAEARKLTGNFESNKGRLPFPVSGKYSITSTFGRQQYEGVTIDSRGIEVQTAPGTRVHAVYAGTVRAVSYVNMMNKAVVVSHGSYFTIYGGLGTLTVKKGDKVVTGQALGTLFTDNTENVTRLYFEIRRGGVELNPLEWLAR